jgi:WD40 repeat protein
MASVFISYSRKDQNVVRKLYDALAAAGRDAWVDWEGIPPSAEWLKEVYTGIEAADNFVFMLSPDSLESEICGLEVAHAVENRKRIIPLVCREVNRQEVEANEKLKALSAINWILVRDTDSFDNAFEQLRFALDTDLDYWHLSSRLLIRAKEWGQGAKNANRTLRGPELAEAERWVAQGADKEPRPTALQLDYITASRRTTNTRQRRFLTSVITALIITLILAITSTVLFVNVQAQNRQLTQDLILARAHQYADEAKAAQAGGQVGTAVQRATQAFRTLNDLTTRDTLLSTVLAYPQLKAVLTDTTLNTQLHKYVDYTYAMAFDTADSSWLTLRGDGSVMRWDVATHTESMLFHISDLDPTAAEYVLAVSPDGRYMVTVAGLLATMPAVDAWEIPSGRNLWHFTYPHGLEFATVSIDQDDTTVYLIVTCYLSCLYAGGPFVVRVDARTGTLLNLVAFSTASAGGASVQGMAVSPDGRRLLTIVGQGIGIWDMASKKLLSVYPLSIDVSDAAWSPDGSYVLCGGALPGTPSNGFVEHSVVRVKVSDKTTTSLRGTLGDVQTVAFGGDDATIATSDLGAQLQIWDLNSKGLVQHFLPLEGSNGFLPEPLSGTDTVDSDVVFRPHSAMLAQSLSGETNFWDSTTGQRGRSIPYMWSPVFSPDGATLAAYTGTSAAQSLVALFDAVTDERILTFTSSTACYQTYFEPPLVFSPDSKQLEGLCMKGGTTTLFARRWSVADGSLIAEQPLTGSGAIVSSLQQREAKVSPDLSIAAISAGRTIYLWNITTGQPVGQLAASGFIQDFAFSPDSRRMAVIDTEGFTTMWDLTQQRELFAFSDTTQTANYGVFMGSTNRVIFSHDGRRIAVLVDGDCTIWDLTTHDVFVHLFHNTEALNVVQYPAFSWDDHTFAWVGATSALDDIDPFGPISMALNPSDWFEHAFKILGQPNTSCGQ